MDFPADADMNWVLMLAPPNATWEGASVCQDNCPPTTFPLRHPFAGLAAYGGRLLADGMNDRGLAGGILWIDDSAASYNYSNDGRQALTFADLLPYLLANLETVQEAVDFMNPDTLQVTTDFGEELYVALGLEYGKLPQHISLMDATGDAALVEFSADPDKPWTIYRNATVVANDPTYPEQQAAVQQWEEFIRSPAYLSDQNPMAQEPEAVQLPGPYGSFGRFSRMTMLVDLCAEEAAYPTVGTWSPAFNDAQATPSMPAIAAAQSILASVEKPWGVVSAGTAGSNTLVSMLRAHTLGTYLLRTPLDPRWRGFNLTAMDWGAQKEAGVQQLSLATHASDWWRDLGKAGAM